MSVAQEMVHIHQSRTGDNALIADVTEARSEVAKQIDLKLGSRSKIGVAAFGGKNVVAVAVPVEPSFSEAGPSRDHSLISSGRPFHAVQGNQIFFLQAGNSPGIRFKIIDQQSRGQLKFACQPGGFNRPGKIGGLDLSISHWAGYAKTSSVGERPLRLDELGNDLVESAMLLAGENSLGGNCQVAVLSLEICKPRIGTTNIAGEDHFSKFLQRRPSRSSSSSASFGPQVPEA